MTDRDLGYLLYSLEHAANQTEAIHIMAKVIKEMAERIQALEPEKKVKAS